MLFDQALKGFGYPVALTHAHHRTVISYQEQQSFFNLLAQFVGQAIDSNKLSYKKILPL
jgi:hypothetical protein